MTEQEQTAKFEAFFKENGDLLPKILIEYPTEALWFYNLIREGMRREGQDVYSNTWVLFQKDGNHILCYDKREKTAYLDHSKVWLVFIERFKFNELKINNFCIPILECYFNCEVNHVNNYVGNDPKFNAKHSITLFPDETRLKIGDIKLNDSFLKEHEAQLPNGFLWLYDMIQEGIRKEKRNEYPDRWFLFDTAGNFLFEYNEKTQIVFIDYYNVYEFLMNKLIDKEDVKKMCKTIYEQYFNCQVKEAKLDPLMPLFIAKKIFNCPSC